jgi:hypothetical protein
MTAAITRRAELAHRSSNGIDVYLFWEEPTNRVTLNILDARTHNSFALDVDRRHALDTFNHPYAYAAQGGTTGLGAPLDDLAASPAEDNNSQEPTINPRRSDHARTDR